MIGSKIMAIRNENQLTQKEFAKRTGISYGTLQAYEYGTQYPRYDYLMKLSDMFNVSMLFFLDNSDNRFVTDSLLIRKSPQNRFLIDSLVIPKSQKADSLVPHSQSNSHSNDLVKIPVFDDVYASAGHGLINEEHISRHIEVDKASLRAYFGLTSFNDLSIINARGNSMLPTIPPNCQLLIQKGLPREEQICVTRIDDELYIKRLQKRPKYKLISDNKSYDDIDLEGEDYEILGIVVGMFQKMT